MLSGFIFFISNVGEMFCKDSMSLLVDVLLRFLLPVEFGDDLDVPPGESTCFR